MEKMAITTPPPPPVNRSRGEVVAPPASAPRPASATPLLTVPTTLQPSAVAQVQPSVAQSALKTALQAPSELTPEEAPQAERALTASENLELAATAEKLNAAVAIAQRSIQFAVHEETGRTIITVSDKETGEEIRTIPPETLLRVAEHIEEILSDKVDALRGLLINHEV